MIFENSNTSEYTMTIMISNTITSSSNEKIKFLRKLGQKKYRDDSGMFYVENLKTICDAFDSGYIFDSLFITQDIYEKEAQLLKPILNNSQAVFIINEQINKSFSFLDTPSGICAVYKKSIKKIDLSKSVIYLNSINDPGNLGTILRTALAFDFCNIVIDETSVDLYNPKTLGAAKDAVFKLNIELDDNQFLLKKIKTDMPIYATRLTDAIELSELNPPDLFCIVFGNEALGISESTSKLADQFIGIRMNKQMESLNVAITASIMLYRLRKN
ncbi:MAG: hypothetical protein A2Y40_04505 [Candidatus Margulisbacteria bacterium GWF2_35_9]|nr:MAG: hypothetical protein A2Y40_04505 [Candidatus Margulisbacteria bacterium GWF2_35_9]